MNHNLNHENHIMINLLRVDAVEPAANKNEILVFPPTADRFSKNKKNIEKVFQMIKIIRLNIPTVIRQSSFFFILKNWMRNSFSFGFQSAANFESQLFPLFEGRVTRGEFVSSESDFRFGFVFVQTISVRRESSILVSNWIGET